MEHKRKTQLKYTKENCKPAYDKNGDIVMDRELFDLLCEEHNCLWEIENKIENGKLLELACKKGDKVYQADCVRIYELTVLGIRVFNNKFYYETQGVGFDNTAIGKSIFLTREEAEKRLEALKK